jgi:hypothetical protein
MITNPMTEIHTVNATFERRSPITSSEKRSHAVGGGSAGGPPSGSSIARLLAGSTPALRSVSRTRGHSSVGATGLRADGGATGADGGATGAGGGATGAGAASARTARGAAGAGASGSSSHGLSGGGLGGSEEISVHRAPSRARSPLLTSRDCSDSASGGLSGRSAQGSSLASAAAGGAPAPPPSTSAARLTGSGEYAES